MEPPVQLLLDSPKLVLYTRMFERVLEEEREGRERFYDDTSLPKKTEFINGKIILPQPVENRHLRTSSRLLLLASLFVQIHDLGFVGHERIMISLTRNDYEPDLCFFAKEKAQTFTRDQMKYPAPDFIAEILSPSTAARDRGIKFEDYAAHGVGEYWLLDPEADIVEQYVLEGGRYALRLKSGSGEIESVMIEGFLIPVRALFDDAVNLREVRRIVQIQ